jgi:hypothetical protein
MSLRPYQEAELEVQDRNRQARLTFTDKHEMRRESFSDSLARRHRCNSENISNFDSSIFIATPSSHNP